jgi:hypothetical protein
MDQRVKPELPAVVEREQQVLLDQLDLLELRAGQRVLPGTQDLQVLLDLPELRGLALQDQRVLLDLRVQPDQQVLQDQVLLVQRVLLDQVQPDQQVLQDQVLLVLQVLLELQV